MTDKPKTIETTGVDLVTPAALKDRVCEFFAGIDLSKKGQYRVGSMLVSVSRFKDGALIARAAVNGIELASVRREDFAESYTLTGQDAGDKVVARVINPDANDVAVDIARTRYVPVGYGIYTREDTEIVNPGERIRVAEAMGIKI